MGSPSTRYWPSCWTTSGQRPTTHNLGFHPSSSLCCQRTRTRNTCFHDLVLPTTNHPVLSSSLQPKFTPAPRSLCPSTKKHLGTAPADHQTRYHPPISQVVLFCFSAHPLVIISHHCRAVARLMNCDSYEYSSSFPIALPILSTVPTTAVLSHKYIYWRT